MQIIYAKMRGDYITHYLPTLRAFQTRIIPEHSAENHKSYSVVL